MTRYFTGGAICGGTLAVCTAALVATAAAQAPRVDARAEVAAALYAASATHAAAQRLADEQLGEARDRLAQARARIDELRARDASMRGELAAAQEAYIAELTARDRAFAQEIAVFRRAVEDIATTLEGAAALARFNAGDEAGAIGVLDQLVDARDRARRAGAGIETAAERRRVARLALDAYSRRRVGRDSVIARFEEVVRLDPAVYEDWVELRRLYSYAGRLRRPDELRAAERAAATARNESQRGDALYEWGKGLHWSRDYTAAQRRLEESLALRRRLAAADPSSRELGVDVLDALHALGETRASGGALDAAGAHFAEEAALARRWFETEPSSGMGARVVAALHRIGELHADERNHTAARARLEEALAFARSALGRSPASLRRHVLVTSSLEKLARAARAQGDLAYERARLEELVAALRVGAPAQAARFAARVPPELLERARAEESARSAARATNGSPATEDEEGLPRMGEDLAAQGEREIARVTDQFAGRRTGERAAAAERPPTSEASLTEESLRRMGEELARLRAQGERELAQVTVAIEASDRAWKASEQDSLASTLERLGGVMIAQGDLSAALPVRREALAIRRRDAVGPNDFRLERANVALGDLLMRLGDYAAARAHFTELAASRRRAAAPSNGRSDALLPIALVAVARAALAEGDVQSARAAAQESLDLRRREFAVSHDARDERWIAEGLVELGDALIAQGDVAGARGAYEEGLRIRRRLFSPGDPAPGEARRLARNLVRLCDALIRQGEIAQARAQCEEGRRILSGLDPGDESGLDKDIALSDFPLGEIALLERRNADARRHLRAARAACRGYVAHAPADVQQRLDLLGAEFRLAQAESDEAGVGRAAAQWRALPAAHRNAQRRWAADLEQVSRR